MPLKFADSSINISRSKLFNRHAQEVLWFLDQGETDAFLRSLQASQERQRVLLRHVLTSRQTPVWSSRGHCQQLVIVSGQGTLLEFARIRPGNMG